MNTDTNALTMSNQGRIHARNQGETFGQFVVIIAFAIGICFLSVWILRAIRKR